MKRVLLTVLLLCATLLAVTPVQHNGQLTVNTATGKVVNKNGYPVQLRGMSSHGLQWFGEFMNPTAFAALRDNWGADIVRLSMYIQEGGYEDDPTGYTEWMDDLIDEVTAAGLYVLVDFHQLNPGDPNYNIEHAKDFFEHISATHKNKNNIFYEICNEPNNETGVVTWSMIKSYANTIIPIIRANDDHNIIVVGTAEWDQRPDQAINSRVNDDNVLYTVHFYAASHGEFERAYLEEAVDAKLPVIVTESGTQEASGDGANDFNAADEWYDYLDSNKISWVSWNFSNDAREGAVFENWATHSETKAYYESDDNLKEAGVYIKQRMQTPDDWGSSTESKIITATAEVGGSISPSGLVYVEVNGSQAFTITPTTGYKIADVKVNGVSKGAVSTVTVSNVTADQTVTATFVVDANAAGPDLVEIGSWEASNGATKASASVDTSKQSSDNEISGSIILTGTDSDDDCWGQIAGYPAGSFDQLSRISVTYQSDDSLRLTLEDSALASLGVPYGYTLPATGSSFSTVLITVEQLAQPEWAASENLSASLKLNEVVGVAIAVEPKPGSADFTFTEIRLDGFVQEIDTTTDTTDTTTTPVDTFTLVVNNGSGDGSYGEGSSVTVTANTAPTGQEFIGWSGDTTGLGLGSSSTKSITMPGHDVTITALYGDKTDTTTDTSTTEDSLNFVYIAGWEADADDYGTASTVDTTGIEADGLVEGSITLIADPDPAADQYSWGKVAAYAAGSYENMAAVTVTYSSNKEINLVIEDTILGADGISYFYALPATNGMQTVTVNLNEFAQADWVADENLTAPLDKGAIVGISFEATEKPATTDLSVTALYVEGFEPEIQVTAIEVAAPALQKQVIGVTHSAIHLSGLADNAVKVSLIDLRGRKIFERSVALNNGASQMTLPASLCRNSVMILSVEGITTHAVQKILLK